VTTQQTYVDFHIIQSLPPSNLNRDDTGSPKSAVYGGARRARVSSQAWKRATRMFFAAKQDERLKAVRTRRLHELLTTRLKEAAGLPPVLAERVSRRLITTLGIKAGKRADELAYLLFFGFPQIDAVAAQVEELRLADDVGDAELESLLEPVRLDQALQEGHPVDVALFGRMVADLPKLNVDAAVQVAHALSTHGVETSFDYFTAVDDENPSEDTGAGMIGNVEFNSATYYRYATVGLAQLAENLSGSWDAALAALDLFAEGFALSIPSGHQTSFAHRTRPVLVAAVLREDQPVNLVSAFEAPVLPDRGVLDRSVSRLATYFAAEQERWGDPPAARFATFAADLLDGQTTAQVEGALGPNLTFPALRQGLRDALAERA
jgi:CRISPR system Cascade subunit CasC